MRGAAERYFVKTALSSVTLHPGQLPAGQIEIRPLSVAEQQQSAALRFTLIGLGIALLGSRIGVPFGDTQMSVVGPAVLVLAAIAFIYGQLCFQRTRLALYILLCSLTFASVAIGAIEPERFGFNTSWPSLAQFLLLTAPVTLRFTEPVDENTFFAGVNALLAIIAIAGILQFFAQFAGVSVFSFRGILPDRFLFENGYNLKNSIGVGVYLKSNGFFLLEASMFSQFMALGLSIEILVLRRVRYMVLLLAGLIVSLAGTGWLILGSFILATAIGMKGRGIVLALATVALLGCGLAILAFAAPDFFASFSARIGEFSAPGSSGHARFVAPFWTVQDVVWRAPWSVLVGIGAGVGERLHILPYSQSLNTPVKLFIEFGLPVTITYIALLNAGWKTRAQAILLVPGMVMILFTGSYAQIPPMLYPIFLILCIATLKPSDRQMSVPAPAAGRSFQPTPTQV
jgi:hypothetical protein